MLTNNIISFMFRSKMKTSFPAFDSFEERKVCYLLNIFLCYYRFILQKILNRLVVIIQTININISR